MDWAYATQKPDAIERDALSGIRKDKEEVAQELPARTFSFVLSEAISIFVARNLQCYPSRYFTEFYCRIMLFSCTFKFLCLAWKHLAKTKWYKKIKGEKCAQRMLV